MAASRSPETRYSTSTPGNRYQGDDKEEKTTAGTTTTVLAKLHAFHDKVRSRLAPAGRSRFDVDPTRELFQQYGRVRKLVAAAWPGALDQLPDRKGAKISTYHYLDDIRYYVERGELEFLLEDIEYIIRVVSSESSIQVPSMVATREGVFFAGQHYDAFKLVRDMLRHARTSIFVVDSYVDSDVLDLLGEKGADVAIRILTKQQSQNMRAAAERFNKQHGGLEIRCSNEFHDRFIVIDDVDFYHFGASIKDLGSKGFMFSRIEEPGVVDLLRTRFEKAWRDAAESKH